MKQKILKISGGVFAILAIGLFVYHIQSNVDAIRANQYTCQADGSYASVTTGDGAITTGDQTQATLALNWLHSMTKTSTVVTTASTLAPNIEQPASYTGSIPGTFTLTGATYPTKSDASIEITSPSVVPDSYAGVIQGKVLTTPTAFRWIIQVYKRTSGGDVQVAKQALADASTGEFTIDLSDVSSPPAGKWAFGILDATAGYAEYGTKWPSVAYYDGLEVQQKLVTDSIYDWNTTKALADNTFVFPNSNNGKKLFRLVDTASGDVLAEHVVPTGLIRSFIIDNPSDPAYGTALENQSYVYDQAVALFAAIGANDDALSETLAKGLLEFQQKTGPYAGGFVFAAPQMSPTYRDALFRTGAHAIAADALLSYIEKYPQATDIAIYKAAAEDSLAFIDELLSTSGTTSGLYLGGYGDYTGPGDSFDANVAIPWASTEHNIDIWNTFVKASKVLTDTPINYTQKATTLNIAIASKLYSTAEQRLYQGMQASGVDTSDPLDVNSWGAMQLYSSGQYDEALAALERLEPFKFTSGPVTGYAPFYDSAGYPDATPTVWFEGSYGVALALYHVGDYEKYRALLDELSDGQESDGSFRYATDEDALYSINTRKSVASTAWYILATTGRSAIWNICQYDPPIDPIVTPDPPVVTQPTIPSKPSTPSEPSTPSKSENQEMTNNNTEPETTVTDPEEVEEPTKETTNAVKTDETKKEPDAFSWTPIIIVGSSIAGIGILWAAIALIRSRLG